MNDHESIHAAGQNQKELRTRARAQAKITVRDSLAEPCYQTASLVCPPAPVGKRRHPGA